VPLPHPKNAQFFEDDEQTQVPFLQQHANPTRIANYTQNFDQRQVTIIQPPKTAVGHLQAQQSALKNLPKQSARERNPDAMEITEYRSDSPSDSIRNDVPHDQPAASQTVWSKQLNNVRLEANDGLESLS
jgi:hypothetical protein